MSENVMIVGAGAMGAGIAQVCAQAACRVLLTDLEQAALDKALAGMQKSLEKLHSKGRIEESPEVVAGRVTTGLMSKDGLPEAPEVTLAIEAVFEDVELKRDVLAKVEAAVSATCLIATNTSGIPIGKLAEALSSPARFVGMHFFNPAVLMRMVEVVRGQATSDEAFAKAVEVVSGLGKDPLPVKLDLPGFVLNRISMVASNEAIRLVEMGAAEAADVDRGVKGAFGWKMGPLETADLVGLDVLLSARGQIYEHTKDERFKPPDLIKKKVEAGELGRKTGKGFYEYK
jgi:3-hydroxybutyryl-CoA dehydrogenase